MRPVLEMKIKISASTIKPQRIEQKAGEKSVWDYPRSPRLEKVTYCALEPTIRVFITFL